MKSNRTRCTATITILVTSAICCGQSAPATQPASQDGWIVFASAADGDAEICKCRPDGSERTQITSNSAFDASPSCSPDGKRLAFVSDRDGPPAIYISGIDGSDFRRIADCGDKHSRIAWSPDGTRIAFDVTAGRSLTIHLAEVGAASTGSKPLINDGMWPAWSPDGKSILFNRGNLPHMFLADADGTNVRPLIKAEGEVLPDLAPIWSAGGGTVFYTAVAGVDGQAMKYEIRSVAADGSGVKAIRPIKESVAVALAPDGSRILYVSESVGDAGLRILNLADNSVMKLTDEVVGPWASWCR